MDDTLPGLAPSRAQFELLFQPDGYWTLRTWAGDKPGFRLARDWIVYEDLTLEEVVDVFQATVSCWRNA